MSCNHIVYVCSRRAAQDGFLKSCRPQLRSARVSSPARPGNHQQGSKYKNSFGSYECKLCLPLHNNEESYLAQTQGKKHQGNLTRSTAKKAKEAPSSMQPEKPRIEQKKFVKIGRSGYRVTKQRNFDKQSAVVAVPDRLSGNNRRYYSAASLHVSLRAENLTPRSQVAISAVCCGTLRDDRIEGAFPGS